MSPNERSAISGVAIHADTSSAPRSRFPGAPPPERAGAVAEGHAYSNFARRPVTEREAQWGPALIGCDGIWSKTREKIVGDGRPRVSGHIAYRAVLKREDVPDDLWRPDVILWAGPRTHFVHYPLRRGELYNLVAVFHSDRYVEGWNEEDDPKELWTRFDGQRPEVLRLLERIETWRMWVLCDREPIKDWTSGRLTLLGDAAHPMLQYLAQGACMATEDAVCLAEKVAERPDDLPAAFKAYQQQR
jgi:salicylate hydroxylase